MDSEDFSKILKEASIKLTENGLDASSIKRLRDDALLKEVVGKWPPTEAAHFAHGGAAELEAHAERLTLASEKLSAAGEAGIAGRLADLAGEITDAAGIVGPWPEGGD